MSNANERLIRLRRIMRENGVDACYLPTSDDHGSESIAPHFRAREYYSGFTGSAGTLLVTQTDAYLWTDGRYFLQAEDELFCTRIRLQRAGEDGVPTVAELIRDRLANRTLGFDFTATTLHAYLHTLAPLQQYGVKIVDFAASLGWRNRPPMPESVLMPIVSGETCGERLARIRATLHDGETLLLTSLDEIAWVTRLRGRDLEYSPVFYAYLTVSQDAATLYTDAELTFSVRSELDCAKIGHAPYGEIFAWAKTATKVWTDENVSLALYMALPQRETRLEPTCVHRWKAIKTEREIREMREAHMADGLSVTRLLLHLKDGRSFTELSAAAMLETIRAMDGKYLFPSFATIAAAGAHGAIVHYEPNEETNAPLGDGLFLLDCGGQYFYGTTDVTRTVALGTPTAEQIRNYTAVLRGHLAVAMATFDETECGDGLDKLARAPLHALGLDYNHGTGHGVGFFLSVHETPPSIRKTAGEPFAAGMVVSDEPGVYLAGQYGIRIENLLLCVPAPLLTEEHPCAERTQDDAFPCFAKQNGGRCSRLEARANEGNILSFEPLTYVPYDRNLIDAAALTDAERRYINDYHAEIYRRYLPYLSDWERDQLRTACTPL